MTVVSRRQRCVLAVATLLGVALAGCTGAAAEGGLAEPSPLPSTAGTDAPPSSDPPGDAGDETPTASPTPTPSPTETEPSPTDSATEAVALEPSAALAAAAVRRAAREECEGGGDLADDFHRVVDDRDDVLLVFVTCFVGAYQANGELLAYDGELRTWPVEQWADGRLVDTPEVVGDVATMPDGTIENVVRYRSIGDCGLFQRWRVEDARLVLIEAREQQCDDGAPAPVEQWPLVHGG